MVDGNVLFAEDHYFRLMASMRICRMEIPMNFTFEYFEDQILSLTNSLQISNSARVRLSVYRNSGGLYLPNTNDIHFIIQAQSLKLKSYLYSNAAYEVELYKDFYVSKHLLSTLKTTNKMIHITGSIFAKENDYDNCFLINDDKNVVEALNGNVFMKMNNTIITPPISEGCLNGVMRKQIIGLINKTDGFECLEKPISPFDLQKSDELFISNVIKGIQPITKYRKKIFETNVSKQLIDKLNLTFKV